MARWTGGAKWGEAPAPRGQRDTPLVLSLSEWLDSADDGQQELPTHKRTWAAGKGRNPKAQKWEREPAEDNLSKPGRTLNSLVLAIAANLRTATEEVEIHGLWFEEAPTHLKNLAEDQRWEFVFLPLRPKRRALYPARPTNRFPASAGLREAQAKN